MTSRERILMACNHREPDRVPVDLGGDRASGISAIGYAQLRRYLGLPVNPVRVYAPVTQLGIVEQDVLDRFHLDAIELGRGFALEDKHWVDWVLPDGTPCQMLAWARPEREPDRWVLKSKTGRVLGHMPDGALYFDQTYWPLADEAGPRALADALRECLWTAFPSPPGPLAAGADGLKSLREGARALRANTDRAILYRFSGNILEIGMFLHGADRLFLLMASEPEKAHRFFDEVVAMHLANLEKQLPLIGEFIDIVGYSDDLGMQTGPLLSPRMYREFIKPRHQAMWRRTKELADVKVFLHCCGGVRELIPDLIDAGLDILNPVQITCRGMDARELKAEFGKDLVFWGGGCDTRHVLPNGTPQEVRRHVREQVSIFSPGGGFVFNQVHAIQANVPPENIVAMFEAVN